jgi:hypothetical protein
MSDDSLFLSGRPQRVTSIACLLQRHRWDDTNMVCTCCGLSQREYAIRNRKDDDVKKVTFVSKDHWDAYWESRFDATPRTHEDTTYRHRNPRLYLSIPDDNSVPVEVWGRYKEDGVFLVIKSNNGTWQYDSPTMWKQLPDNIHFTPWYYRYVGPRCRWSGSVLLGKFDSNANFSIRLKEWSSTDHTKWALWFPGEA